ncbi:MAG: GntR family transcriptional regulator [Myxococcota bacterium]|nr:GntR family transcriptional regulator [Myxococcota bacterium]
MFEPVKPAPTAVDICEQKIRDGILTGHLAQGEFLPSERVLAERFQLNRLTVRSALARLTAAGLLSVRQGSGYRVNDYRLHGSGDLLGHLRSQLTTRRQENEFVQTLLQIRRGLYQAVLEVLLDIDEETRRTVCRQIDDLIDALTDASNCREYAERELHGIREMLCTIDHIPLLLTLNPVLKTLHEETRIWALNYANAKRKADGYRIFKYWLEQKDKDALVPLIGELKRFDVWTLRQLESKQFDGQLKVI